MESVKRENPLVVMWFSIHGRLQQCILPMNKRSMDPSVLFSKARIRIFRPISWMLLSTDEEGRRLCTVKIELCELCGLHFFVL